MENPQEGAFRRALIPLGFLLLVATALLIVRIRHRAEVIRRVPLQDTFPQKAAIPLRGVILPVPMQHRPGVIREVVPLQDMSLRKGVTLLQEVLHPAAIVPPARLSAALREVVPHHLVLREGV